MERVCCLLQVKKEKLDEYLRAHEVWPELLDAMREAGIKNNSIFYRSDGLIVVYLESENAKQSLERLGQTDVNRRWDEYMAEYFEGGSGDMESDGVEWLKQYFYLA